MALAILLFVFFIVILMIAFFVFPPTTWLEWFYQEGGHAKPETPSAKAAKSDSKVV